MRNELICCSEAILAKYSEKQKDGMNGAKQQHLSAQPQLSIRLRLTGRNIKTCRGDRCRPFGTQQHLTSYQDGTKFKADNVDRPGFRSGKQLLSIESNPVETCVLSNHRVKVVTPFDGSKAYKVNGYGDG
jgi:hypothetical protein